MAIILGAVRTKGRDLSVGRAVGRSALWNEQTNEPTLVCECIDTVFMNAWRYQKQYIFVLPTVLLLPQSYFWVDFAAAVGLPWEGVPSFFCCWAMMTYGTSPRLLLLNTVQLLSVVGEYVAT